MHTTNLRKVGGSMMLAVPPALLRALGCARERRSQSVRKTAGGPADAGHYTLHELLAQCDPNARRSKPHRDCGW